ncbi:uncharacterized protein LOC122947425 [Acropora millepora]|uniref:uncharacterized protein LOC122947425 n=1 Tax=Acropora millepora TaxID=45264 RepID=UPI001CF130D9|nr:uncharacterized protein LOC122947425 [Acropora millepora]
MAMRARATYDSADEVSRLLWEENDDSELESGTSEEEEAELEHQLRSFNEESRLKQRITTLRIHLCQDHSLCQIWRMAFQYDGEFGKRNSELYAIYKQVETADYILPTLFDKS